MTGRHSAHRSNAHEETLRLRPVRPAWAGAPRAPRHALADPAQIAGLARLSENTGRLMAVLRSMR